MNHLSYHLIIIQIIIAIRIPFLEGYDGDEHNAHQNIITITIEAMMILIIHT
jgi:hypothetical protein